MAISIVQTPTRTSTSAPGPSQTISFASLPTIGNYVFVVSNTGSSFGTHPTTTTVTDNQGHTYTVNRASGQDSYTTIAWAKVATSSGTFTVTASSNGTDLGVGVSAFEASGIAASSENDTGVSITLSESTGFGTTWNFSTGVPDTAEELIIVAFSPRNQGSLSNVATPTNYTDLFEVLSGNGPGYCAYRITSTAAAQSFDFTTYPDGGSPGLLVRAFRAAGASAGNLAWITA